MQSYNIISLYLLGNLVTTTHTLPILFGLIPGRWTERIVTPFTAIFGCWVGFAAVVVYAALKRHSWGLSLSAALHQVCLDGALLPSTSPIAGLAESEPACSLRCLAPSDRQRLEC